MKVSIISPLIHIRRYSPYMNDERGSLWRKWDLHVHTPASIEQKYGGETDEAWEKYVEDLQRLPPEFKVIGVNDYIFLDGYKRLKAEKTAGRLPNIDLLLPVIELRIDRFAGTEGHLSRVNYHVIFSDELRLDDIEQQFLNGLMTGYQLSPEYQSLTHKWGGLLTRDNLERLGRLIIESAPPERRHQFDDPLTEGFRAVNISLDQLKKLLENPLFSGKFLCAVGKAEWDQMRWTRSIAEKRTVINKVDLVFTAAESPAHWRSAKEALTTAGVNNRLLDCSDAHAFSSSADKDRIGNCFTWIKADTTFDGLRQALNEPEERIFIGDEPEQLQRVRENKTKYISSISVTKAPGSRLSEEWFDFTLPLNHGLVAIIGNRGMGKSALADTIALLGDSHSTKFSFLDPRHFRNPKDNKARHFIGTLVWESGKEVPRNLDEVESQSAAMMVRYVPQNLFEEICNELPGSGKGAFGQELSDVIFSHVKEEERLGCGSLDELIRFKTDEVQRDLTELRSKLKATNAQIARLENELSPAARKALDEKIAIKREELKVHDESRPEDRTPPTTDQTIVQQLEEKRLALDKVEAAIKQAQDELSRFKVQEATLRKVVSRLDRFSKHVEEVQKEVDQELSTFSLTSGAVLQVKIDLDPIKKLEAEVSESIRSTQGKIAEHGENNLWAEKQSLEAQIQALQAQLDGPAREYQNHLNALRVWKAKKEKIVGDVDQTDSLAFLQDRLARLTDIVPAELEAARSERSKSMQEIFRQLEGLAATYRQLYRPVQDFLDKHGWVKEELKLEFGVSLEVDQFEERFFGHINQGRKGAFHGVDEGRKLLRQMIAGINFNEEEQVTGFVQGILTKLEAAPGGLLSQLKDSRVDSLYDTLFALEYIQPRYTLNVGGRGLESLSPGERGMLLLVFYLLVDQGDVPLIIDQPEENLDNQSVFRLLVPCIKEVRKRRQIILVTHNPNLAVVCDAEQVVHAFIDKENKNRVVYTAGSIENPHINRKIVDVLEGTWPAFKNRAVKYDLFPAQAAELQVLGEVRLSASPKTGGIRGEQTELPWTQSD